MAVQDASWNEAMRRLAKLQRGEKTIEPGDSMSLRTKSQLSFELQGDWDEMKKKEMEARKKNRTPQEIADLELLCGVFDEIDTDGNHTLDKEEIRTFLTALEIMPTQCAKIFKQLDRNGNDEVDIGEWLDNLSEHHRKSICYYVRKKRADGIPFAVNKQMTSMQINKESKETESILPPINKSKKGLAAMLMAFDSCEG